MNKLYFTLLLFILSSFSLFSQEDIKYKNARLSSDERTRDLIKRMTLDEKIGQLLCPLGWEMYTKQGNKVSASDKYKALVDDKHVGMYWAVYRADPWTKKTLITGLNPQLAASAGNAMQTYAVKNTRLGIPVFIAEEAPHGHMAIGATVFPAGIGLASTWNPMLIEEIATVISKEIRLQGGHISYGPILDVSRDSRWSRVEESYGEDPVLTAILGEAYVKGTGAGDLSKPYSTIATLKHFVAYGIPEGGHNGNIAHIGERELFESFLPPFETAIDAGALSVMTSYNSIDGIPCTANKYLLTDVLRDRWNFGGFVVSDLVSIDGLAQDHHVAQSMQDAGTMAIAAGVDADLGANAFATLGKAVNEGKIEESVIDSAVYRILKLKFDMGLFENPYVDASLAKNVVGSKEHLTYALQAAQQSIVLLENNGILPLKKELKNIAVIGPNADNHYNQLGDYTAPQKDEDVKTVLDGVRAKVPNANVKYVKGCAIRDTTNTNIAEAVAIAKNADIAIVVVGGSSARDFKTEYLETGAAIASKNTLSDIECGEGFDRSNLDLLGKQMELLEAVKATGTPVVVIYIQGRPLNMNWASENADALINAWYPGQRGGDAIADVLFGDYNPAGRLPISVPRSVGQIPVYYNKKHPRGRDYVETEVTPLYSFGYGLSYTDFEYKDLIVEAKDSMNYNISFTVKNVGDRSGDEVAQLYVRDEVASVVQPNKQLKRFERINIKPGEEKIISFALNKEDLSILNRDMKRVVEPGVFTIMIGPSSDNIKLESQFEIK